MKRATIFLTGGLAASLLAGCAAKASPQRAPIAIGIEAAATGANRDAVVEPKGRTGTETDLEGCEVAGLER